MRPPKLATFISYALLGLGTVQAFASGVECMSSALRDEPITLPGPEGNENQELGSQVSMFLDWFFPSRVETRYKAELQAYRTAIAKLETSIKAGRKDQKATAATAASQTVVNANQEALMTAQALFKKAGVETTLELPPGAKPGSLMGLRLDLGQLQNEGLAQNTKKLLAIAQKRGDIAYFVPGQLFLDGNYGSYSSDTRVIQLGAISLAADMLSLESSTGQHEIAVHANNSYRVRLPKLLGPEIQQRLTGLSGDLTRPMPKNSSWYSSYRRHDEIQARLNGNIPVFVRRFEKAPNAKLFDDIIVKYNEALNLLSADIKDYENIVEAVRQDSSAIKNTYIYGSSLLFFEANQKNRKALRARLRIGIRVEVPGSTPEESSRFITTDTYFDFHRDVGQSTAEFKKLFKSIAKNPSSTPSEKTKLMRSIMIDHLEIMVADMKALQSRINPLTNELNQAIKLKDEARKLEAIKKIKAVLSATPF